MGVGGNRDGCRGGNKPADTDDDALRRAAPGELNFPRPSCRTLGTQMTPPFTEVYGGLGATAAAASPSSALTFSPATAAAAAEKDDDDTGAPMHLGLPGRARGRRLARVLVSCGEKHRGGTRREYSLKPFKHSIFARILVFKR